MKQKKKKKVVENSFESTQLGEANIEGDSESMCHYIKYFSDIQSVQICHTFKNVFCFNSKKFFVHGLKVQAKKKHVCKIFVLLWTVYKVSSSSAVQLSSTGIQKNGYLDRL